MVNCKKSVDFLDATVYNQYQNGTSVSESRTGKREGARGPVRNRFVAVPPYKDGPGAVHGQNQ